jgi:hypothetical protein
VRSTEELVVEYRLGAPDPIERFLIGRVTGIRRRRNGIRSPSLHQLDEEVHVEPAGDPVSAGPFSIEYDSRAYVDIRAGGTYLFAIASGWCVGLLPVSGDQVGLPDGQSVPKDDYIRTHLNRPFPDYFGFTEEISP